METSQTSEALNESWVQLAAELDGDDDSIVVKSADDDVEPQTVLTDVPTIDKHLLKKAQHKLTPNSGSSVGSIKTISGNGTPDSHTPRWEDDLSILNVLENSERVWDWASRPELVPPPGFEAKMWHPGMFIFFGPVC